MFCLVTLVNHPNLNAARAASEALADWAVKNN